MFPYIIALLLVNTYSNSFVSPLPTNASKGPVVSDWLSVLAKNCKNPFLAAQINSNLKNCSVAVSPFGENQFECMLFYDINTRLCEAIASAKLTLEEDYTAKINQAFDVNTLCLTSKDFVISNLAEHPSYKATVERIFATPATCARVCGMPVVDILSQDTNFYCKYFKWGSDMLAHQLGAAPTQSDIFVPPASVEPAQKIDSKPQPAVIMPQHPSAVVNSKTDHSTANSAPRPDELTQLDNVNDNLKSDNPLTNIEDPKPDDVQPSPINNQASGLEINAVSVKNPSVVEAKAPESDPEPLGVEDKAPGPEPQLDPSANVKANEEGMEKPSAAEIPPLDNGVINLEDPLKGPSTELKEPAAVVEQSKQQSANDMYPDSEEGIDTQGDDDGDDPILGNLDVNPVKVTQKKVENTVSKDDSYANTPQDEYPEDEDQVFYPFFLTAVILVILLYVLYHNKNKVSKVFLGLIVEGRQSGRRRNSRGHAYRRLDTLEQAMSANTAAPPSKIIY